MSENRARYHIAVMCRILDVSPSGYYAWAKRPACERAAMDAALTAQIRVAHAAPKGTYGAPRLQIDLADAGIHVSRKRVARLMRNAGLAGVTRRKSRVTTVRDGARQAPDLVNRDFTADNRQSTSARQGIRICSPANGGDPWGRRFLGITFERQLADLRVQGLHINRKLHRSVAAAETENIGRPFLKLALPLRDLVRMDVEMLRQLSSSRSAVVKPSARRPSSRSTWATQLPIACAEGSNPLASSSGVRPARTSSTISRRSSGA